MPISPIDSSSPSDQDPDMIDRGACDRQHIVERHRKVGDGDLHDRAAHATTRLDVRDRRRTVLVRQGVVARLFSCAAA